MNSVYTRDQCTRELCRISECEAETTQQSSRPAARHDKQYIGHDHNLTSIIRLHRRTM